MSIADRVYPLTIKPDEEEHIRSAAKTIDGILKKYGEGYAVKDKQDLLAMCALQLASRLERNKGKELIDANDVEGKLHHIQQLLEAATR